MIEFKNRDFEFLTDACIYYFGDFDDTKHSVNNQKHITGYNNGNI